MRRRVRVGGDRGREVGIGRAVGGGVERPGGRGGRHEIPEQLGECGFVPAPAARPHLPAQRDRLGERHGGGRRGGRQALQHRRQRCIGRPFPEGADEARMRHAPLRVARQHEMLEPGADEPLAPHGVRVAVQGEIELLVEPPGHARRDGAAEQRVALGAPRRGVPRTARPGAGDRSAVLAPAGRDEMLEPRGDLPTGDLRRDIGVAGLVIRLVEQRARREGERPGIGRIEGEEREIRERRGIGKGGAVAGAEEGRVEPGVRNRPLLRREREEKRQGLRARDRAGRAAFQRALQMADIVIGRGLPPVPDALLPEMRLRIECRILGQRGEIGVGGKVEDRVEEVSRAMLGPLGLAGRGCRVGHGGRR